MITTADHQRATRTQKQRSHKMCDVARDTMAEPHAHTTARVTLACQIVATLTNDPDERADAMALLDGLQGGQA